MNTDEPDASEWREPDLEHEPNFDAPMKAQVTDDLETEVNA